MNFRLLTPPSANPKTKKGIELGYYTAILHLAPYKIAGCENSCPASTPHCREICLYYCGRGGMINPQYNTNNIIRARIAKTRSFFKDTKYFLEELNIDILAAKTAAKKKNLELCVRLNGTSDIDWEDYRLADEGETIFELHPEIQFYDYTKDHKRIYRENRPDNLYLLLSYSGSNMRACKQALKFNVNVAVIFKGELPKKHWGHTVIDGDKHDLRFIDKCPVIVGLQAKGVANRVVGNRAVVEV